MPVVPTHTYPGVYIQEVPSGTRTIIGVSTSITAFLGRALRGPVNEPTTITSYADFERTFGGLWSESALGYSVRDFYLNGGSQAIIVRLYNANGQQPPPPMPPRPTTTVTEVKAVPSSAATPPDAGNQSQSTGGSSSNVPAPVPSSTPGPVTSKTNAVLSVGGLTLEARYPGTWGNNLSAAIDPPDVRTDKDAQQRFGLNRADLFNLTVNDAQTNTSEIFRNVSVKPGPQQVNALLATGSRLVFAPDPLPQSVAIPATGKVEDANKIADDGGLLAQADFLGGQNDTFQANKQGLYALEKVDLFNLLCIPPYNNDDVDPAVISEAAAYCEKRRAMLLVDPLSAWADKNTVSQAMDDPVQSLGTSSPNAMLFFPRFKRAGSWNTYTPSGAIAGIIARTDTQRGVWKAPAGLSATIAGVSELAVPLTDEENGVLNPLGVNCLRSMVGVGPVVWGARTLQGNDILASEWKYIPVRRLALYIEESLYRGTKWAVFEPNSEPLWAQLRLNIGAFMHNLFRQGAFQGQTPKDAYFVQCDSTTTTQEDIDQGIVNILVGYAPVKPAEFVILYLQQIAGEVAV